MKRQGHDDISAPMDRGGPMSMGFADRPQDLDAARAVLKALPGRERRAVLGAVGSGRRVEDARHAGLATALAAGQRRQVRRFLWLTPLMGAAIAGGVWLLDRGAEDPLSLPGLVIFGVLGWLFSAAVFSWQLRRAHAAEVLNEELAASVPAGSAAQLDAPTAEIVRSGATTVPGAGLYQASAAVLLVAAAINLIELPMPEGLLNLLTPGMVFGFALHEVRNRPGRAGALLAVMHAFGVAHFASVGSVAIAVPGVLLTAAGFLLAVAALIVSRDHRRSQRRERRRVEELGGPRRLWSWYRGQPRWRQILLAVLIGPPAVFILSAMAWGIAEAIIEDVTGR